MAVTLKTIAERVGVSIQAVSYVINDRDVEMRISPIRAAEIRRVARELNYVPNGAARAMMSRRTRQVGVLVNVGHHGSTVHPRALETIMGINAALEPSGNVVVMIPVTGDSAKDKVESRVFRERLLDALVMLEDVPENDAARALALVGDAVWVNGNRWAGTNCIRRDEKAAGAEVVKQLGELGYRKLIYVDKDVTGHFSREDRWEGVQAAVAGRMALERFEVGMIPDVSALPLALRQVSRDTAVIASDAYNARICQRIYGDLGLRPGIDFGLACCDDADEFSWTWPNLARVRFDRFAMGQRAGEMMLRKLTESNAVLESELIVGKWVPGSTASPVV